MAPAAQLLPGTLDVLILQAVSFAPLDGYGVRLRIGQISNDALDLAAAIAAAMSATPQEV